MKLSRLIVASIIVVAIISGCSTNMPRNIEWQQGIVPPKTIVLMPVRNKSESSDGARFVEKSVPDVLRNKGYEIADRDEANRSLEAAGITTTDQAWKTPVQKLGSIVNADGLMFVSVDLWQKSYELTDTNARVVLVYVLYNKAGKKLWSWKQEVFNVPGTNYADTTGDIVADVLIQVVVGGALSHSTTRLEGLAAKANELALNSGKSPLPNYR